MNWKMLPVLSLIVAASPTYALACAEGARCLSAPVSAAPVISAGDVLAPGSFNMLLNSHYFGLPRAEAGTIYVTMNRRVLKIRPDTYEVVDDVTDETNRAF